MQYNPPPQAVDNFHEEHLHSMRHSPAASRSSSEYWNYVAACLTSKSDHRLADPFMVWNLTLITAVQTRIFGAQTRIMLLVISTRVCGLTLCLGGQMRLFRGEIQQSPRKKPHQSSIIIATLSTRRF
ncbi:hypothetical protein D9757_012108 [Collybiopsis confluens]|uniref:Uncharacterized protein n=1 Tax=Collybiopsis confluens TaxID=2823264 RepID=A0A8H5D4D3_9AGAR|nr:hypothetical protein D9757_012108 [Collybiopsis confluens]